MKFLIFGGTGFVGRALIQYLKDQGEDVVHVSRSGKNDSIALDITNEKDFLNLDVIPDVIVNCASVTPKKGRTSKDPEFLRELFSTNVIGAVNICNWAIKKEVPKVINCSTLVVVRKPWPIPLKEEHQNPPTGYHVGYAMSKLGQEQLMNECFEGSSSQLIHLRLSAVYGPGMSAEGIIFDTLKKLERNEDVNLKDSRKNSIDLIHVRDVSRVIYSISKGPLKDKILNVAKGEELLIWDLVHLLKKLKQSDSKILNSDSNLSASPSAIDISRLEKYLGREFTKFTPYEDGLKEIIDFEKKNNF
ncbi:NAD-dependent epimerase/dehydratase family protein [Salinimicrobium terrae]|uniref:NAD-dependent epimerase/dehydratase family protein n=1 Tax=Salinimicrobium terrae TaxID=470866 RepID=UPI000425D2C1|nr:NAD(P)-dependent oxidoreductase [Salinimicrobium terrae]